MSNTKIIRGESVVGGGRGPAPWKPFVIEARMLSSTEQAVPLRVVHGRSRAAGVAIYPAFDFGSEEISERVGK